MKGLQEPPSQDRPTRVVARLLVLTVLLVCVAAAVWSAVTEQRVELTEDISLGSLERQDVIDANGLSINVTEGSGGTIPVVFLHDVDIAGSVVWDGVVERLGDGFHPLMVDLPGFGLSQRLPNPGRPHTVSSMATTVSAVVEERLDVPVIAVGVGLGGEVAAEMAVTRPDLVGGVVMVDVDFWSDDGWLGLGERLPWIGLAMTHTFEASGRFAADRWAPHCGEGGWCPTLEQVAARDLATSVEGTSQSLKAFRETPASSLVPSDLDEITVPVSYVWSTEGVVPLESVDMVEERLGDMPVIEVDTWKTHLESPGTVVEAIDSVGG